MSREYTNKLVAMIEDGILDANTVAIACIAYMSESDVQDMMHMNQWDNTIDDDGTEENDTEEGAEITVGDTVNVDGVEYVAMQGPERWACTECAGNHNQLCNKLPDCGGFIFVRKVG